MWLLSLRDRHNGNLMLDDEGHFFHIDFGFVLGHSTGKGIGGMVESAPWKLTAEYIELLDGPGSDVYTKYCAGCVAAMKAARQQGEAICTMVEITGTRSNFPCFMHAPVEQIVPRLRERLLMHKADDEVEAETMRLLKTAHMNKGTLYYDKAQKMQRGILY